MNLILQIIGVLALVSGIVAAVVFFGIPAWAPDRKPDKETLIIISFLGCLIALVIIGAVLWENVMK